MHFGAPQRRLTLAAAMRKWQEADGTHRDVRGLPVAQPMVAILRLLQTAGEGTAFVAHLASATVQAIEGLLHRRSVNSSRAHGPIVQTAQQAPAILCVLPNDPKRDQGYAASHRPWGRRARTR
ncbi:MAG: hypothetical protein ABI696_10100 [Rubrivivax sp.]